MFKRLVLACVVLGSLGALTLASKKPWWRVPNGFEVADDGSIKATVEEPPVALLYKKGCRLLIVSLVLLAISGRMARQLLRQIITSALTATLLFPYFITVWQPGASARAAWLQRTGEPDLARGRYLHERRVHRHSAQVGRLPSRHAEESLDLRPTAEPNAWDLDLNRLPDLLDWLGYTEPFCEFIGKGSIFAILGLSGLLTAACVADREVHRERITHAARLAVTQLILRRPSPGFFLSPPVTSSTQPRPSPSGATMRAH